jgi:hypothetical protein
VQRGLERERMAANNVSAEGERASRSTSGTDRHIAVESSKSEGTEGAILGSLPLQDGTWGRKVLMTSDEAVLDCRHQLRSGI